MSVLQRFAEVYQVRDLLAEMLAQREAREFLMTRTLEVVPSDPLARGSRRCRPGRLCGA